MTDRFPLSVRTAFTSLREEAAHIATNPPRWPEVFTPDNHSGALDPQRTVVIGDRGTGKSFWSSVLVDTGTRNLVATRYPRLKLDKVRAALAFSDGEMKASHPSRDEIQALIRAGYRAEDLWRAVLLRLAPCDVAGMPAAASGWNDIVAWVASDPARRNGDFRALDEALTRDNVTYLLVFDALDVIGPTWKAIREQMEGVIRLALSLRALRAIRIKLFIRPDMADDRRLWEVGDASKLRHNELVLTWRRRDLYGLLWTHLANATGTDEAAAAGTEFREHLQRAHSANFEQEDDSWLPSQDLLYDETRQEAVFHALAGEFMGPTARRGDTYKWVPNHLADAEGFAAPRSFLLAMRTAAETSRSQETVLDIAGIQEGTRSASRTRVGELSEDYRWMNTVLNAMHGLVVPITQSDLIRSWTDNEVLKGLRDPAGDRGQDRRAIPPGTVLEVGNDMDAYKELIAQMIRLKIFIRLSDDRINIPDLFRLQANIRRKGGMKPRA